MGTSKFDDLLTILGTGPWNIVFFLANCMREFTHAPQFLSGVYLAPAIEYTCVPPAGVNISSISKDSCSYFVNETLDNGHIHTRSYPCTEWEYDNSTYISTLTSEFDLVCGRAHLRATYQSMPVIAKTITTPLIGFLCDRYGRKSMIVITQSLQAFMSLIMSFSYDITLILIIRFIQGAVSLNVIYALALEVCEIKQRSFVGVLMALPWAAGSMAFGGIAYLIREWRYLHLCCSLINFCNFIFFFLIDESPRWLIVKEKHEDALKVLNKASRWNKVKLPPEPTLKHMFQEIKREHEASTRTSAESRPMTIRKASDYIPKIFSTKKIRLRALIISLIMVINEFVFVGLSLSGDIYSSDPFLYVVISSLMEVPGYTIAAPIINWLGRKKPAVGFYLFCGIVVFGLTFIPEDITWLPMTLAMLGKLSNTMAFMIFTVYMNELYPTEVKMQGVSVAVSSSCIGIILAPYLTSYIGPMVPWLPSVLFGCSSFLASVLILPLPETLGKPMIDTIDELEGHSKKDTRYDGEPTEEKLSLNEMKLDEKDS